RNRPQTRLLPTGFDTPPARYLSVPPLLLLEPERRLRVFVHAARGWHCLQKATLNCSGVGSKAVACATCFTSCRSFQKSRRSRFAMLSPLWVSIRNPHGW